ncbi:MAG: hypothetical protein JWM16_2321 [Verrucomicrobiales bacterium]|nr:hypothetical protein [Verrucomicrobiales bacterium]
MMDVETLNPFSDDVIQGKTEPREIWPNASGERKVSLVKGED